MATNSYILIIAGIAAIIMELLLGAATGFDLLIIGIVCIVSGILGILLQSFPAALSLVMVLTLLYVFAGRKLLKSSFSIATKKTNIDAVIGKKGTVVKKIQSHRPGQVKVEGEVWRAESDLSLDADTEVTVQSVTGITLKVHPVKTG